MHGYDRNESKESLELISCRSEGNWIYVMWKWKFMFLSYVSRTNFVFKTNKLQHFSLQKGFLSRKTFSNPYANKRNLLYSFPQIQGQQSWFSLSACPYLSATVSTAVVLLPFLVKLVPFPQLQPLNAHRIKKDRCPWSYLSWLWISSLEWNETMLAL